MPRNTIWIINIICIWNSTANMALTTVNLTGLMFSEFQSEIALAFLFQECREELKRGIASGWGQCRFVQHPSVQDFSPSICHRQKWFGLPITKDRYNSWPGQIIATNRALWSPLVFVAVLICCCFGFLCLTEVCVSIYLLTLMSTN